jgi:hypothetical protein
MRRLPGIQIPTGARAPSIRLAYWPVAAFVVASCLLVPPKKRQRARTALPGGSYALRAHDSVLAFAKIIARERRGFRRDGTSRLSTCSPLPRYGV